MRSNKKIVKEIRKHLRSQYGDFQYNLHRMSFGTRLQVALGVLLKKYQKPDALVEEFTHDMEKEGVV